MFTEFNAAQRRGVRLACAFADRFTDPATGLIGSEKSLEPQEHTSVNGAFAYLLSGEPERAVRARAMLAKLGVLKGKFAIAAALLAVHKMGSLLDDSFRAQVLESVRGAADTEDQDIIAGRNINLPVKTWAVRIAGGAMLKRPDLTAAGRRALEQLTDLVAAHGSIPEFNSPTYHALTLEALRVICLTGEPETIRLAAPLEQHLWANMAWRWHPNLGQLCGPWSRAYHDSLVGASGNVLLLGEMAWGGVFDEGVAYDYDHAHDHLFGVLLALLADETPVDARKIALKKAFPLTVTSAAEQIDFQIGDGWVPGGVAELTTWMDEHLAVGTGSRGHVHAMQSATYLAQWSRTGRPVEKLSDLGQAFTRFTQNGRRPGDPQQVYRSHHRGHSFTIGKPLWADDGRAFALQSGATALVVYVPKGQERRFVQSLEAMMVVPRLDTVDAVLVNGEAVEEYEGAPDGAVVVRSGRCALGLRFAACDPNLTTPRLVVERCQDHLLVGLRLVAFDDERELAELEYRRYGASVGAELRYTPEERDVSALMKDMLEAEVLDHWRMAIQGGPREVAFRVGDKRLYGRFAPVAETWLRRILPEPGGSHHRLTFNPA